MTGDSRTEYACDGKMHFRRGEDDWENPGVSGPWRERSACDGSCSNAARTRALPDVRESCAAIARVEEASESRLRFRDLQRALKEGDLLEVRALRARRRVRRFHPRRVEERSCSLGEIDAKAKELLNSSDGLTGIVFERIEAHHHGSGVVMCVVDATDANVPSHVRVWWDSSSRGVGSMRTSPCDGSCRRAVIVPRQEIVWSAHEVDLG